MTTTNKVMTQAQFEHAQDKIDALVRASKRGTPERAEAERVSEEWEAAIAAPQSTAAQRQSRLELIAATAVRLGLV